MSNIGLKIGLNVIHPVPVKDFAQHLAAESDEVQAEFFNEFSEALNNLTAYEKDFQLCRISKYLSAKAKDDMLTLSDGDDE